MTNDFEPENNPSEALIVYGTPFCAMVPPVRRLLDEAGVAYDYIDIRQDREAAARVRAITGGFESVPTIVFPDGKALVEPRVQALREALLARDQDNATLQSSGAAFKAGLSNPMVLILALIALALVVAIVLRM
jgi:mycoredoxin